MTAAPSSPGCGECPRSLSPPSSPATDPRGEVCTLPRRWSIAGTFRPTIWRLAHHPASELLFETLEELAHQHLRHAAQHPLTDSGDRPANVAVAHHVDQRGVALIDQLDRRDAPHEPGAAL